MFHFLSRPCVSETVETDERDETPETLETRETAETAERARRSVMWDLGFGICIVALSIANWTIVNWLKMGFGLWARGFDMCIFTIPIGTPFN